MAVPQYRMISVACKVCGNEFEVLHRTGRYPTVCSPECRRVARKDILAKAPRLTCQIDGCGKPARHGRQAVCSMHYHRRYRTGHYCRAEPARKWVNQSDGYRVAIEPSHPLACRDGTVREHRMVAYDKYGAGPHCCHWCAKELDWASICVDHLNGIKADNEPANLVVSCNGCNGSRAKMLAFIGKVTAERMDDLLSMVNEAVACRACASTPRGREGK